MRSAVVVITLAACGFPPEPKSPAPVPLIAAPETLTMKPLKAGQWVLYREHVGGSDIGTVVLAATHQAACGMWFIAELRGSESTRTWQFCIGSDGRIANATLDGSRIDPAEHATELAPLRTRVLPPSIAGPSVRDEAHVPAGHFFGTLRIDGATTTWLHPAVPLGAVVRVRDGDREDVLLAYGETLESEPGPEKRQPPRRKRLPIFYEAGLSHGSVSGLPAGVPDSINALRLTAGSRVADRLHLEGSLVLGTNLFSTRSAQTATSTIFWGAGLRWSPWRREYLQLMAGYAGIGEASGLGLLLEGGFDVTHGTDWAFVVAGDVEGALAYGGDGRDAFDVTFAIRLDAP